MRRLGRLGSRRKALPRRLALVDDSLPLVSQRDFGPQAEWQLAGVETRLDLAVYPVQKVGQLLEPFAQDQETRIERIDALYSLLHRRFGITKRRESQRILVIGIEVAEQVGVEIDVLDSKHDILRAHGADGKPVKRLDHAKPVPGVLPEGRMRPAEDRMSTR